MLIEQAFLALPEILHGSGYQDQDYEAGLVNAFSLALLQVLNGRNVPNPISCLQHERPYRKGGNFPGYATARHLRADLFLTTEKLRVASKRLSQYGWRHDAWLEAKFLRKGAGDNGDKHSGNKSTYVAAFLADIIRLISLVPEGNGQSRVARYFLHVYDADPKYYLTLGNRPWLKALIQPGAASIDLDKLDSLPDTLKKLLGTLPGIKIEAKLTNLVVRPTDETHRPVYHCYLTRLDSFVCTFGQHIATLHSDRRMEQSLNDSMDQIAAFVAEHLSIQKGSNELQPPPEVDAEDMETDVPGETETSSSES